MTTAADGSLWVGAGPGHCLGLCGGGTEISYSFQPGIIQPFQLTTPALAIGPRLPVVRNRTTTAAIFCGSATPCIGTARFGQAFWERGSRHFATYARTAFSIQPGQTQRVPLTLSRSAAKFLEGNEYLGQRVKVADAEAHAERGVSLHFPRPAT